LRTIKFNKITAIVIQRECGGDALEEALRAVGDQGASSLRLTVAHQNGSWLERPDWLRLIAAFTATSRACGYGFPAA
jgi:hypothetical protein